MQHYRDGGYVVWKTEHWCSFSRKRKDLLGFIDVLAFNDDIMIGVQDTTWGQVSARKKKILASPLAWDWLGSSERTIEIIGWKAPDKDKGRHRWEHKILHITLEDFIHGRPEPE
jgi:hypothetical protein